MSLLAAMIVLGCERPPPDSSWQAPAWGPLPTDTATPPDGRHEDTRDTGDTNQSNALEALYIVDAVFGVFQNPTGDRGYLVLSAEPISCAVAMTFQDYPYGIYVELKGPEGADTLGGWDGEYAFCGAAPCMSDGFWMNSGASGTLPPETVVEIRDSGPHSLQASWGVQAEIRAENCQDADSW